MKVVRIVRMNPTAEEECEFCFGSGRYFGATCPVCKGSGVKTRKS